MHLSRARDGVTLPPTATARHSFGVEYVIRNKSRISRFPLQSHHLQPRPQIKATSKHFADPHPPAGPAYSPLAWTTKQHPSASDSNRDSGQAGADGPETSDRRPVQLTEGREKWRFQREEGGQLRRRDPRAQGEAQTRVPGWCKGGGRPPALRDRAVRQAASSRAAPAAMSHPATPPLLAQRGPTHPRTGPEAAACALTPACSASRPPFLPRPPSYHLGVQAGGSPSVPPGGGCIMWPCSSAGRGADPGPF